MSFVFYAEVALGVEPVASRQRHSEDGLQKQPILGVDVLPDDEDPGTSS